MLLNTASQSIGAQMITAADGTAFTGAVTVAVTIDSGTQATGTVGSGACAHEGNGYHSYRPSQAETNGAHIAFTFTGTGAIPATVQVFTRAGDSFTRLGAPAGASVSADIAAVKVDTAAILVDTGTTLDARIPAALVSGRMDCSVGAMAANTMTAAAAAADLTTELQNGLATAAALATVDTVVDGIKAVTDNLPDSGALTSLATAAALATVDSVVDAIQTSTANLPSDPADQSLIIAATNSLASSIADLPTNAELATALDALPTAAENTTAVLTTQMTEAYAADGAAPTLAQALFAIQQFLQERGVSGATLTVNRLDGTTPAMTFTLDDDTAPTSITRAT